MRERRLRAAQMLLAAAHAGAACFAWLAATGWGTRRPDAAATAAAIAVTAVATAACVALAVPSRWRGKLAAAAAAALLLAAQVALVGSLGASRYCDESAFASGPLGSADGAWRVSLRVCEPHSARHFARLDLTRVSDRRAFTLPLRVRRGPRDAISRRERWISMTPSGPSSYWIALSTAVARGGPQFFELRVDEDPPALREVRRGLTVEGGVPVWDCRIWGGGDGSDPLETVCSADGPLPPAKSCALSRLADECDDRLARAALCRPDLAAGPEVGACLARLSRKDPPGLAWDARVAVSLEADEPAGTLELLDRARASQETAGVPCAESRDAARRLAVARRHESTSRQRLALVDLAALADGGGLDGCGAWDAPFASEWDAPAARRTWEIAAIDREWGFVDRSCERVLALVARAEAGGDGGAVDPDAEAWAAGCRERRGALSP